MTLTDGFYTYQTLGPADVRYGNSGFTEAIVLEAGVIIAHFYGPFAKMNGQRFYRSKTQECTYAKTHESQEDTQQ